MQRKKGEIVCLDENEHYTEVLFAMQKHSKKLKKTTCRVVFSYLKEL